MFLAISGSTNSKVPSYNYISRSCPVFNFDHCCHSKDDKLSNWQAMKREFRKTFGCDDFHSILSGHLEKWYRVVFTCVSKMRTHLHWFCIARLLLASRLFFAIVSLGFSPLSQPIGSKTKTKCDLIVGSIFALLAPAACLCFEF